MTKNNGALAQKYSNAQFLPHFILLSFISFGIYNLVWLYRNWKYLKEHKHLNISPEWRTAGLFVPLWGIFLVYQQFKDIDHYCREEDITAIYPPGTMLAGYLILTLAYKLPDPFWMIAFLSITPLAIVQKRLNLYWSKVQPDLCEREGFTSGQIILIVFGVVFWVLAIIGASIHK